MTVDEKGRTLSVLKKIIVGYGAEAQADDALALGGALGRLTGAELVVARVFQYEAFLDPNVPALAAPPRDLMDTRKAEVLEALEPVAATVNATAEVVVGPSAPQGLHALAENLGADLIVAGSSHRGRAGQVLMGTVGERLFHGAPCAVAVAPRGFAENGPFTLDEIGVGYDGGPESELALDKAADLCEGTGARVKVFAAAPPTPFGKGWNVGVDVVKVYERDDLQRWLHSAVARLPATSHAEGVLLNGHPAEVLAEQEVDLMVVGSRGYGPLRTVLLGGVSGSLVRHARNPVLVVPGCATRPAHPR